MTKGPPLTTWRFQWNRTASKVGESLDMEAPQERESHTKYTHAPYYSSLDSFVPRGSVNKCSSQVEIAGDSAEGWASMSKLAEPEVIYKKIRLPVRTGSNVQMGKEKCDFDSMTTVSYKANSKIQPPKCAGRTAWNRTLSKVPMGKAEYDPDVLSSTNSVLHGAKDMTESFKQPRYLKTNSIARTSTIAASSDPNFPECTDGGHCNNPAANPYEMSRSTGLKIKGSVNKYNSLVDITSGEPPNEGFLSHNSTKYLPPDREALWKGPGPHVRTRSNWVPGGVKPDFNTVNGTNLVRHNVRDVGERFGWARTASKVDLDSGENHFPTPHYAATHNVSLDVKNLGPRVVKGQVNKCQSEITLENKGIAGRYPEGTHHNGTYTKVEIPQKEKLPVRTSSKVSMEMTKDPTNASMNTYYYAQHTLPAPNAYSRHRIPIRTASTVNLTPNEVVLQ